MPTTKTRTQVEHVETFNGGSPGQIIDSGNSIFDYVDGTPGPSYWAPAPIFVGGGIAGFQRGTPSGKSFNNYTYLEWDSLPSPSSSSSTTYGPAPLTWEEYYDYYVFINGPSEDPPYDTWENFWDWVTTFAADNGMTTDDLWLLFKGAYFPTGQAEYITYTYIRHRIKSYWFDIRWVAIPLDSAPRSGSDSITTELRLETFTIPITININGDPLHGTYQPALETWYRYGADRTDPTPSGDFFGPMTWTFSDLGGTPLLQRAASYYTDDLHLSTILKVNGPTYSVSVEYRDFHIVVETETEVIGSEVWYPEPEDCNLEDFEDGVAGEPLPDNGTGGLIPSGVYTTDSHSGLLAGRFDTGAAWLGDAMSSGDPSIWFKIEEPPTLPARLGVTHVVVLDTDPYLYEVGATVAGPGNPYGEPAGNLVLQAAAAGVSLFTIDLGPAPIGEWMFLRATLGASSMEGSLYNYCGELLGVVSNPVVREVNSYTHAIAGAVAGGAIIIDDYACDVPAPIPDCPGPPPRGSCSCSGGSQALTSYMNLCGNELINAARTTRYIQHGLVPPGFSFRCEGCEGLSDILPCLGDEPLPGGYQLPELDGAPWYDPQVPESKNFAGLYVLSAKMSAPYSRSVTGNIGVGSSLGRLKLKGRDIVVRGWLVGKTCCSVQYGLQWLTDVLGGDPCGSGDCGGCDLDFLRCCPSIGDAEDSCLVTQDEDGNQTIYVRPDSDSEYQRAEDFFARMHNVGVVDGPNVLSCKGGNCGCGCGTIIEVEFTLHAGSPYMNSLAEEVFTVDPFPGCAEEDDSCPVVWQIGPTCETADRCKPADNCLEDPFCPSPKLPPTKGRALPLGCGCIPLRTERFCSTIIPQKDWGSSTLNFEVYAGSKPIRNLAIRVFQNPQLRDCGDREFFDECEACATLIVNYVPAGGTLRFSGEERRVTVTCGAMTRSAARNISGLDDLPFAWPDLSCVPMCACVDIDCASTASDASIRIFRVDRSL